MGGTRSLCFNTGYHDLRAVISKLSLVVYVRTYVQVGYYSNTKDMLQIV